METLAIAVRESKEFNGIKIEGEKTKIIQYAYDTTMIQSGEKSAHNLRVSGSLSDLFKNRRNVDGLLERKQYEAIRYRMVQSN